MLEKLELFTDTFTPVLGYSAWIRAEKSRDYMWTCQTLSDIAAETSTHPRSGGLRATHGGNLKIKHCNLNIASPFWLIFTWKRNNYGTLKHGDSLHFDASIQCHFVRLNVKVLNLKFKKEFHKTVVWCFKISYHSLQWKLVPLITTSIVYIFSQNTNSMSHF